MELTSAIENYFRDKINHLDNLVDINDESIECSARISKIAGNQSGDIFKAEISLHTAGKNYGAESEKDNLYAAIDDVVDMVGRKISSYKDKKRSLFKKGGQKFKELLRGF